MAWWLLTRLADNCNLPQLRAQVCWRLSMRQVLAVAPEKDDTELMAPRAPSSASAHSRPTPPASRELIALENPCIASTLLGATTLSTHFRKPRRVGAGHSTVSNLVACRHSLKNSSSAIKTRWASAADVEAAEPQPASGTTMSNAAKTAQWQMRPFKSFPQWFERTPGPSFADITSEPLCRPTLISKL
jgi:hypothetical protein